MTMAAPNPLMVAISTIHYGFPCLVFIYFVLTLTITVCTLKTQSLRVKDQHVRRDIILMLIVSAIGTYLAETIAVLVKIVFKSGWSPGQDRVVYLISSAIVFGLETLVLIDTQFPVWYPYYGTWFTGLVVELALVIISTHYQPPRSIFDFVFVVIQVLRISVFVVLPCLYFGLRNDHKEYDNSDAERQSLLRRKLAPKPPSSDSTANGDRYGAVVDASTQDSDTAGDVSDAESDDSFLEEQRKARELISKRLKQDGNWWTYAKGFTVFFPYVWPVHSKTLQFRAVLVGICLLVSNALNVLVPNQLGVMVDSLTQYVQGDNNRNIWVPVVVYTTLLFVSGGAGIGWLRKWLWMPLEQYSYDSLSTAAHSHLMSLSSDFHDNKTSSDLSQAISGGRSVADLLETVCFEVVPMFIDLAVAFAYLWSLFGPYMGLLMAVTVISYLYITTKLIAMRAEKRRGLIAVMRKEWTVGQQSLDGWNTASLFNMIPYERRRYDSAVKDHLKARWSFEISSQTIVAAQALVTSLGLLGALYLGIYQVAYEGKSIGKFTVLIVYWAQLQGPLVFFSSMYRNISYSLMDAERLLELFQTKPAITDIPSAKPLKLGNGVVKFDRVCFGYDDRKPTLKNVSFTVPSGNTVALVGETGGGKSTILKLIDRFYDVNSGSISIDGQDIRDVTVDSLRGNIGVVPQEPMLFNDSIMNNIRYARLTASDKEVYMACKAAAIHDKIMSFPDGYNSKVGDRGVKLSGGEKQRVAIARAILKQPEIILLDEATSAVDTETEQLIQEGFNSLCKNRTTIIVAHRLSTIMRADRIMVVMDGEIIEEGSHQELIHSKGKYHDLWSKQVFMKPDDEQLGSRSQENPDANLRDHLNPVQQTAPSSVEHDGKGQTTSIPKNGGHVSSSSHKREASKLKPDAREFVPLCLQVETLDVATQMQSNESTKQAQKKSNREESKGKSSWGKKAAKKAAKAPDRPDYAKDSTGEETQSAGPSNEQLTDCDTSGLDKPKSKRARFSRRYMAKSEPATRALGAVDGAQDSDVTAVSSNEGQPIPQISVMPRRRVSAPSDPPAGPQDSRAPQLRRPRHWRLKNRTAEHSGSGTASTVTSSGEVSTDDAASTAAPATSPAAGIQPSTTTIRFAQGC